MRIRDGSSDVCSSDLPRVAFLSFSNFGGRLPERTERVREAIRILDGREVDFEYDGEMQADVALDQDLMQSIYPFCRLSGPATILIMPGLHADRKSAVPGKSVSVRVGPGGYRII